MRACKVSMPKLNPQQLLVSSLPVAGLAVWRRRLYRVRGEKEAETDRQTERLTKLPDRQEAARAGENVPGN